MTNSMDSVLRSFRLRDLVFETLRLPTPNGRGNCIAFERRDLRVSPRPSAGQPAIDFIEIRPGTVPDDSVFRNCCGEHAATPFQSASWLSAWQERFAGHKNAMPVTAIGYSAGTPVFMLPLEVIKKFGVRILSWQAYQMSDYCAPVICQNHPALARSLDGLGIFRQIAQRLGAIDLIYATKLPAEFAGAANPFVLHSAVPYHASAHAVSLPCEERWETFFQRLRSSKTRKRIREKLTALEKLGEVKFTLASTTEEAAEIVERCLAAKTRQLERLGHWDPFAESGMRGFLIDYFSSHADSSTWACRYSVGNETAATAFGFRSPGSWLLYQMALEDNDKTRYSPGTHMLLSLMRHCMEQKVGKLDLALGDEAYKTEWCDVHTSLLVSTLPLTLTGFLAEKMVRARDGLRTRLSGNTALYERAKRLRGVARKFGLPV